MATLTLSPSLATARPRSSHPSAPRSLGRGIAGPIAGPLARPGLASRSGMVGVAGPVRLTRRGRVVVSTALLLASLVLGVVAALAWSAVASDAAAAGNSPAARYVVSAGDTLWSIAAGQAGGGDVRAHMYAIKQMNDLATSSLVPGQVLLLPSR